MNICIIHNIYRGAAGRAVEHTGGKELGRGDTTYWQTAKQSTYYYYDYYYSYYHYYYHCYYHYHYYYYCFGMIGCPHHVLLLA